MRRVTQGERFADARRIFNFGNQQVASRIGVSRNSLTKILDMECQNLSPRIPRKITGAITALNANSLDEEQQNFHLLELARDEVAKIGRRNLSGDCRSMRRTLLRSSRVADGYDPTIGIMHEKREGSSAFIFDLMEPERPAADRKVLEFIKGHVFDPADFVIRSDGVCRLNPEMARCVVQATQLKDPFAEGKCIAQAALAGCIVFQRRFWSRKTTNGQRTGGRGCKQTIFQCSEPPTQTAQLY